MLTALKKIFEHKCPICNEPLLSVNETLCCTKACPEGHYKEESYCSLGVRIVYDGLK